MDPLRILRHARASRRGLGVVLVTTCVVVSPWVAPAPAGAATTASGSMTDTNSCTVTTVASGQITSTADTEAMTISTDASPQPHAGASITLSNTTVAASIPGRQLQTGADVGIIHDGETIPTLVTPVLAASNTVEGTHGYTAAATTATVHIVSGVVQPLVATVTLPSTTLHPVDPAAPVVVSEKSVQVVQTIVIPGLETVTATSVCAPTSGATIVTIDGGQSTTVAGSASDTNACNDTANPQIVPPATDSVLVILATSASPRPHNGQPVTLSGTMLTMTIPIGDVQQAASAGFLHDGSIVPSVVTLVLAASNTSEATHTYVVNVPLHIHVIGGVVQPIVVTVNLPDTTWHPVDGSLPVAFTEHSLTVALSFNLQELAFTQTLACTPTLTPPIVTVDGGTIPAVVPGSASVVEGNAGTTSLQVPVALSFRSARTVTAHWSTEFLGAGPLTEANPADDYTPASGVVSFAPGVTTASVTIPVTGDTRVEPDEVVVVAFGSATNATIGGFYGLGFGTITNDDLPTVLPGGGSVAEGNAGTTALHVPVTLSSPSSQPVTVQWNTAFIAGASAIQATPGTDYTAASGTVTFAPGQTSTSVTISVIGDTTVEPDQWIVVSFHTPTGARVGGYFGLGFGVVTNDD